jgi:hypothetical protein
MPHQNRVEVEGGAEPLLQTLSDASAGQTGGIGDEKCIRMCNVAVSFG